MSELTVGVVGGGVMGISLVQALLTAGIDTVLTDNDPGVLAGVPARLSAAERLARLSTGQGATRRGNLTLPADITALAACDLVIENVVEHQEVKEQVHQRLDEVLDERAAVAVNTSAVPITGLALGTRRPERMVGAHFMNPVAASSMVEVIRTSYTAPWALETLSQVITLLGKQSVVVGDAAGFVINRCLMMFISEAAALLDDGVATPPQVDKIFRGCLGHRTGPLRTADIIGIDTVVRTLDVLSAHYGPERFSPAPRLRQMVADGHLGRKTGQGFYSYYSDGEIT
jgi:3-hydroxyacyl-CoA dehydrogenase